MKFTVNNIQLSNWFDSNWFNVYNAECITTHVYFVTRQSLNTQYDLIVRFGGQTRNYVMRQNEFQQKFIIHTHTVCHTLSLALYIYLYAALTGELSFCFCFHAHNHRRIFEFTVVVHTPQNRAFWLICHTFHSINKSCVHAIRISLIKFTLTIMNAVNSKIPNWW